MEQIGTVYFFGTPGTGKEILELPAFKHYLQENGFIAYSSTGSPGRTLIAEGRDILDCNPENNVGFIEDGKVHVDRCKRLDEFVRAYP
ncbi:hypothetical protein J4210_01630 [Candidatus Woesearchaeota archaeon]|nr:hypothetical protein [Candidatus Woesearchaeota archaeon]